MRLALPLLLAAPGAALAQQMFTPPSGFWIFHRDKKVQDHLYGPTSAEANWFIAQWGIPDELPGFANNGTKNQYAGVQLNPDGSFVLSQDSFNRPCKIKFPTQRVMVNEFDLFAAPQNRPSHGRSPAFPAPSPPLGSMSHAQLGLTLDILEAQASPDACQVMAAEAMTGIVVLNRQAKQVFFYQLIFSAYKQSGKAAMASALSPAGWFFKGENVQSGGHNQFGYGDRVWASYQQSPAVLQTPKTFNVDILGQLTSLIKQGAGFGMDQDLSNWRITSIYFGNALFGHVQFTTKWSNLSLKAE